MKASELRIGNLLLCRGGVSEVLEVYESHIKTEKEDKIPMRIVQGIPLTDEWLLRFGFEKNTTSWVYLQSSKNVKAIRVRIQGKYLFYNDRIISAVHQLQNIYFALTGEELTLKK